MPKTACFHPESPVFFKKKPNATATNTYRIVIELAAPLGKDCAPAALYPFNDPATMSANAAITNKVNNQQNKKNNLRPVLPMYVSMICPIDLP